MPAPTHCDAIRTGANGPRHSATYRLSPSWTGSAPIVRHHAKWVTDREMPTSLSVDECPDGSAWVSFTDCAWQSGYADRIAGLDTSTGALGEPIAVPAPVPAANAAHRADGRGPRPKWRMDRTPCTPAAMSRQHAAGDLASLLAFQRAGVVG